MIVVASSPPKPAAPVPAKPVPPPVFQTENQEEVNAVTEIISEIPPASFTVGVTDVTFNPTNAIFGRLLKAPRGHIVTLAYWQQKENEPHDDVPYFENK